MAQLLGRTPQGAYRVVVRDRTGDPVVLRNAPLLDDGTPMPTLYWLVGSAARLAVDRLEAAGGVRAAEGEVDATALSDAHRRYADERAADLPAGWGGPRPSGGVGGTRQGVKCLHAHYAWHLAGGDDPVGRWVAQRLGPAGIVEVVATTGPVGAAARLPVDSAAVDSAAVAAVDCGTNSTRLLVADGSGRPLVRLMEITRLGQGVDRARVLDPAAVERTVAVLRSYRRVMDAHGVTRVRITATSAARDASNRATFLVAATEAVGSAPELLDGATEAALSFAGAISELASGGGEKAPGPYLVADIGGGSTELAVGPAPGGDPLAPVATVSLDVGCVRLTERHLLSDPPGADEVAAATAAVEDLVDGALQGQPALASGRSFVGLAGTVSALAALDLGPAAGDHQAVHHHWLDRARVEELLAEMSVMTVAERRARPGMEVARADVIVGGAVVLAVLMRRFGHLGCLTSESDILDGMVLSLRRR